MCDPGYEGDADVQCKPINPCEKPHRGGCHRQVLSHYRSKKKCTYTLIDNIDAKELNTLKVNYLLGKGAIENFGSFFFGDYEWPSFLIVDGFFFF